MAASEECVGLEESRQTPLERSRAASSPPGTVGGCPSVGAGGSGIAGVALEVPAPLWHKAGPCDRACSAAFFAVSPPDQLPAIPLKGTRGEGPVNGDEAVRLSSASLPHRTDARTSIQPVGRCGLGLASFLHQSCPSAARFRTLRSVEETLRHGALQLELPPLPRVCLFERSWSQPALQLSDRVERKP